MSPNLKTLAALAMMALAAPQPAMAADLGMQPPAAAEASTDVDMLHSALSRYLSLQMIRATFDVVPRDDLQPSLTRQLALWANRAPSPDAIADLDRQLLAEASYYLVSLQYVIEVGGAAFPPGGSGSHANDSLVRITALQRELPQRIAEGGDVEALLAEAERIRALTEGYAEVPPDFGIFGDHDRILATAWDARMSGTRT